MGTRKPSKREVGREAGLLALFFLLFFLTRQTSFLGLSEHWLEGAPT